MLITFARINQIEISLHFLLEDEVVWIKYEICLNQWWIECITALFLCLITFFFVFFFAFFQQLLLIRIRILKIYTLWCLFNRDLSREFGILILWFSPSVREIFEANLPFIPPNIIIPWVRGVSIKTSNW